MGAPFAGRGERFDDYLTAMKKVWSGETVEHQSDHLDWRGFKSYPLPAQRPHPPIIIGGHSPVALRRAVAMGDGWFGFTNDAAELGEILERLRTTAEAAGRDPSSIEITALWRDFANGMESLDAYREMGVSRLLVPALHLSDPANLDEHLNRLQEDVLAKLPPSS